MRNAVLAVATLAATAAGLMSFATGARAAGPELWWTMSDFTAGGLADPRMGRATLNGEGPATNVDTTFTLGAFSTVNGVFSGQNLGLAAFGNDSYNTVFASVSGRVLSTPANVPQIPANGTLVTAPGALTGGPLGDRVFWASGTSIGAATFSPVTINESYVTGVGTIGGLATDDTHIYVTDGPGARIRRVLLDGTGLEDVKTGIATPRAIAVDDTFVYWSSGTSISRFEKANPANTSSVATGTAPVTGLDVAEGFVYWSMETGHAIGRAKLNGMDPVTGVDNAFLTGFRTPVSLDAVPAAPACSDTAPRDVPYNPVGGADPSTPVAFECTNPAGEPILYAVPTTGGTPDPRPSHGQLRPNELNHGAGTVGYVPEPGYAGPDSFRYDARGTGGYGGKRTLNVNVLPPPAPSCTDVSAQATGYRQPVQIQLTCTGLDASYSIVDQPAKGTITGLDAASGLLTYTPDQGETGADSFTFTAQNPGNPAAAPATVPITIAMPPAPSCTPSSSDVPYETPTAVEMSCTDRDDIEITDPPDHGTLGAVDQQAGTVVYTPDDGYIGSDTYAFRTTTPGGTAASVTKTLQVQAPPTASCTDDGTLLVPYATATSGSLAGSCTGADITSYAITTDPGEGTITDFNPATGAFTYTPEQFFTGTQTLQFTATNPGGTTSEHDFEIEVEAAPAPVCQGMSIDATYETAQTVTLDCAGVDRIHAIEADPSHGTISAFDAAAGTLTYTPESGYLGPDSFDFSAQAPGDVTSGVFTATIEVTEPAAPVCTAASVFTRASTPVELTLSCTGPDSTISITDPPRHGTLGPVDQATGKVTYTPRAAYSGLDRFTFEASNPGGTSVAATAAVEVLPPAPDTLVGAIPKRVKKGKRLMVSFTSTQPGSTFLCALDGAEPSACSSPLFIRTKKLKRRRHLLLVVAVNARGIADPTPVEAAFKLKK